MEAVAILMDLIMSKLTVVLEMKNNLVKVETELKRLCCRASDVEQEVTKAEQTGIKKAKSEVKNWLEEVEKVENDFNELKNRIQDSGRLRNLSSGDTVIKLGERVEQLMEQSHRFDGLLLDHENSVIKLEELHRKKMEAFAAHSAVNMAKRKRNILISVETELKRLSCRAYDFKLEVTLAEQTGKKKSKKEVENWFEEVEQLENKFSAFKTQIQDEGLFTYFINLDSVHRVAGFNARVELLMEQSHCFDGLLLDHDNTVIELEELQRKKMEAFDAHSVSKMVGKKGDISFKDELITVETKLKRLSCRAFDFKLEVTLAEKTGKKKIKKEVENWFEEVEQLENMFSAFINQKQDGGLFTYFINPYVLGRVAQLNVRVNLLMEQSHRFDGLLLDDHEHRGEPQVTTKLFGLMFEEGLKRVWNWLVTDNLSNIGIHGQGGAGKTTLAKHIHNHLLEKTDYSVYWVTVSREFCIKKLQDDIAKKVKLDLSDEDDEDRRAAMLSRSLDQQSVLILDDVWEEFCPESIGIAIGSNKCRLILTTRSLQLCRKMLCQRELNVTSLDTNEAWDLFNYTLGLHTVLAAEVEEIAKLVARRCAGLPFGIIIVAGSMRGITDIREWRTALEKLKAFSMEYKEMEDKVIPILKWSFSRFNGYERLCLLCCCLYQEDRLIKEEELINLFILAELVPRRDAMESEFDHGRKILNKFIKVCLLEKIEDVECVKMHDLIRDMVLKITHGMSIRDITGDVSRFLVKSIEAGSNAILEQKEWTEDLNAVPFILDIDRIEVPPGMSPINLHLTRFPEELPEEKIDDGQMVLALSEELSMEVPMLCHSIQDMNITSNTVKISLLAMLLQIGIFKAESFLMELLNTSASLTVVEKVLIGTLLVDLKLFSTIVRDQLVEIREGLESIFPHIEAVARKITFLSYSLVPSEMTAQMSKTLMLSLADSLNNVKLVKKKLKEISPEFPVFHFPKTNELGFMDFLLHNLGELLNHNPNSIALVKHHIKEIQLHLEFLKPFLIRILNSDTQTLELKDLGEHIIHVAYKVEYAIDMIEIDTNWQQFLWFYDLLDEIRNVKLQATKIHEMAGDARLNQVTHISSHRMSMARSPEIGEMVVSLTDEEKVIICRLTRGSSQTDIVSIVGMPGIGKTTLAKKVYNDPKITYHFHRRAWCSVSQVYGKRDLLLDIIKDIHGLPDEFPQLTDADLELKLCQQLRGKRYLIVMDDVWDTVALNDLKKSFPDDGTGSRILITTRFHEVALEAKPDGVPHLLRPLSDDESWNLLEMRSFPKGGGCPAELVEIGKEIAHQCKGLPLAVVAIAGILESTEKKQDLWERITESLSSKIINDPETRCKDILELSYMHLPFHLRTCFLYFGAFSDDKEVPVSKLIRLWIAEGFIENSEAKSLEDFAEDCLMDLINRSLVMISKRRSNGRVKACCIHDLLRDFCVSKAHEENFLQRITRNNQPYASFDLADYGSDFYDFYPSNSVTYESYRLCIYLKRKHFVSSRPSGPCTRSLIFFACGDTYPRRPYDVSFISDHFKLLRVLDLECINVGIFFPSEIGVLVQLRYLAVSGDMNSIPRLIAKLRKLETFIVKGLSGDKVELPDTIWCMTRLRHLHVNYYAVLNLQDDKTESSFQLENLVSFSFPYLAHDKDADKIIRRLPNLRKLRCIFQEAWDSSMNCYQFPRLDCLTELESLKITYSGTALNPVGFNLPLNLKKLTLSHFRLPWNQICAIGRLPNLEVLKLLFGAFEGQIWDMSEDEFCKLKFLKLDTLNIVQWNASYEHLPKLQQLVLRNCKYLEEVPNDFAGISTLQMIEVEGCRRSVEVSVQKIKEENEEIKVIIS